MNTINNVNNNEQNKPGLVSFGTEQIRAGDNNSAMINATAMAKPFGKHPAQWLRLSSTQSFLKSLAEVKNVPAGTLVKKVIQNNIDGFAKGVWIQEDAALELARWLSPSFAIWNNGRTKELLLTGRTETAQINEEVPVVASSLLSTVEQLEDALHVQARKAVYHDAVLQSRTLIATTVIAKEFGMSAIALNKLLHNKKIIYKSDDHWVLYADYANKGFTGTKTVLYIDSAGKYQSNIHTYWTEKGREFIHEMIKGAKQIA